MANLTYGPATELDFFKLFGVGYADEWKGMALKAGSYVVGIGGYTITEEGKVYGFIDIGSPIARTPILYRRALRFLDQMKQDGFQEVLTICDDSKPNAERFLLRLGFKPTEDFLSGFRVWSKWLH